MATFTTDRTAAGTPARTMVGGDFCEVGTYECSATAANSILQMVKIPAGATLLDLHVVSDALGAGVTFDVGDGDDVDYYIDGADPAAAALFARMSALTAFPKKYAADDTIDVKILGAAATGTITLVARMTMQGVDLT